MIVVIGMVALVLLLPGDRMAQLAAERLSAATGRAVTLDGEARISLYPVLGVSTGRVTIANADWAGDTPMFQADSLKIGVEPRAFFGGDIRITGLEAIAPRVDLRRDAQGRVNWELGVEGVAPSGQAADPAEAPVDPALPRSRRLGLTLDRAYIENATVAYEDAQSGVQFSQSGVDFDLRWPDPEGEAVFDLQVRQEPGPVHLEGTLDNVIALIDGAVSGVEGRLSTPSGEIGFAGRVSTVPEVDGRVTGDVTDMKGFFESLIALAGASDPLPADLFGLGLALETAITLTGGDQLALRETALTLGDTALTGGLDADLSGDKPVVRAQINAGRLDLSGGGGGGSSADGGSGASEGGATPDGWSKDPIDASALAALDGTFALVADSVDLGDLTLGKTRIAATLERSRLVLTVQEVRAYAGLVTGEFVLNNRSGLSVGGNLVARDIDLQPFLTQTIDVSRFSGQGAGELTFLGVGQSVHAIMNSLSGKGGFRTGRGVISGIDLDRIMRGGRVGGGTTVFDSLSASFTMDAGQLYNNDLSMSLPLASASGAGRVGLGPRDIDYTVTPRLLDDTGAGGLAIPVNIRGPWANPRIKPDLEAAIDLNLAAEREALEQQAREELDKTLENELGIEREDGQSLEDAAKDTLGKELEKGLRSLFD